MVRRVLSSPVLYWGWAIVAVAALFLTYPIDPYVYGFTAFGLAWLTGAVTIAAVTAVALWASEWTWPRRLLVVSGVAVAVFAVAQALAILRTFRWA